MKMNRNKAIFYLVLASILWSIGGLFIKLIDWHPMAIASGRSAIASIVMLFYIKRPSKTVCKYKILGACAYAMLTILFVTANKFTTSANAILLQFTAPIWIALFSRCFLKEKILKSDWLTIIIVLLGMSLFFVGDLDRGNTLGNCIALLSGVAMAFVIIFLKLQKKSSPVEMTFWGNILVFIGGIPYFFASSVTTKTIIYIIILGVFQLGISYILYSVAIKYVSAIEAVLIPVIEPLLNPFWVFLITKEAPGKYALLGGFIVIITIIANSLYKQTRKKYIHNV
ncbi:EamA family transporter [Clostridiaceae bacterium M8S5]|nr:EamA family transporter [Clostridiaceae bacterium M8S5]